MKERKGRLLSVVSILAVSGIIWVTSQNQGMFRGSLTSVGDVDIRLKEYADQDNDGTLTAREMRRSLVAIIRGVSRQDAAFDVSKDGVVNGEDTRETIRIFRLFLGAVCGNGTKDAGEFCDDGNTVNEDGCSVRCRVENGYSCQGSPSICAPDTEPGACGNGTVEAGEECDDGNLESGDGCGGSDHPNGPCVAEFCGDGYLDPDGIPDSEGSPLPDTQEECDGGGVCQGGQNDAASCTRFGADPTCGEDSACVTVDDDSCTADCKLP